MRFLLSAFDVAVEESVEPDFLLPFPVAESVAGAQVGFGRSKAIG